MIKIDAGRPENESTGDAEMDKKNIPSTVYYLKKIWTDYVLLVRLIALTSASTDASTMSSPVPLAS
jgi:hypothetical protein